MDEEIIKIDDIIYALKKRWLMILSITIMCSIIAGLISFFLIKPRYEAKIKVFIGKETTIDDNKSYNGNDVQMYQNLMKTYAELVKTKDSISTALKEIKQDANQNNVGRVLGGITVSSSIDTQIMEIKYITQDKSELIPVIESITNVFMEQSIKLIPNGNVQIIEKAQIPKNPVSPNKKLNIIIGFMIGFILSIGIIFLIKYTDNTIDKSEDLENLLSLPNLGEIPNLDDKKLDKKRKKLKLKEKKKKRKEKKNKLDGKGVKE